MEESGQPSSAPAREPASPARAIPRPTCRLVGERPIDILSRQPHGGQRWPCGATVRPAARSGPRLGVGRACGRSALCQPIAGRLLGPHPGMNGHHRLQQGSAFGGALGNSMVGGRDRHDVDHAARQVFAAADAAAADAAMMEAAAAGAINGHLPQPTPPHVFGRQPSMEAPFLESPAAPPELHRAPPHLLPGGTGDTNTTMEESDVGRLAEYFQLDCFVAERADHRGLPHPSHGFQQHELSLGAPHSIGHQPMQGEERFAGWTEDRGKPLALITHPSCATRPATATATATAPHPQHMSSNRPPSAPELGAMGASGGTASYTPPQQQDAVLLQMLRKVHNQLVRDHQRATVLIASLLPGASQAANNAARSSGWNGQTFPQLLDVAHLSQLVNDMEMSQCADRPMAPAVRETLVACPDAPLLHKFTLLFSVRHTT